MAGWSVCRRLETLVLLAVLFVVVQVVVVVILVVFVLVPILVVVLIFLGVLLGLGPRPPLGLLREFQVEFRPAVDVEFLDIAVEVLNLNGFFVLIHSEHLEGFLVFQVLIPLPDGWFVLSSHGSPFFELLLLTAKRILRPSEY